MFALQSHCSLHVHQNCNADNCIFSFLGMSGIDTTLLPSYHILFDNVLCGVYILLETWPRLSYLLLSQADTEFET